MDTVSFLLFTFNDDRRSEVMTRHFSTLSVELLRGELTRFFEAEGCKRRAPEDVREDSQDEAAITSQTNEMKINTFNEPFVPLVMRLEMFVNFRVQLLMKVPSCA